jgi:hypothetical protein
VTVDAEGWAGRVAALLTRNGKEFANWQAGTEGARLRLVASIRDAAEAGVSERRIAGLAGVDRGTVRKALGKGK